MILLCLLFFVFNSSCLQSALILGKITAWLLVFHDRKLKSFRFGTSWRWVNDNGNFNFGMNLFSKETIAMKLYICCLLTFYMVRHGAHRQLTSIKRYAVWVWRVNRLQTDHFNLDSFPLWFHILGNSWGRSDWWLLPEIMDLLFAQTAEVNKGDECLAQCLHFYDGSLN